MAAQKYENLKKVGIVFQGKDICFFFKKIQLEIFFFQKKDTKNRKSQYSK